MRPDELNNLLVQAIERRDEGAIFGQLTSQPGFRVQFPDVSLYAVIVKEIHPAEPVEAPKEGDSHERC